MKKEEKKCCICGNVILGWGNNPWGALDEEGNLITWKPDDECCGECNLNKVILGRFQYQARQKAGS